MPNSVYETLVSAHLTVWRPRQHLGFCVPKIGRMNVVQRLERKIRRTSQIIHVVGGSREAGGSAVDFPEEHPLPSPWWTCRLGAFLERRGTVMEWREPREMTALGLSWD